MRKRQTIQCSLILDAINRIGGHSTADEIYDNLKDDYPSLGRATVYRNLNKLAEEGQIRRVCVPGGADCFEKMCSRHYHVKCMECGEIHDVDMGYMEGLEDRIRNLDGYEILSHDIVFSGICPKCRKKNHSSSD
ncbi:MAG: Fur family transcriptional regulator [Candidatus Ornithospirochaeta sp.]|nr:transcriptional repressor [Sphaerochaetaceae bacterium]MDD7161304.1 transcriptional repressor [Sphaerochaetaceae bacterium]MDY5522473.1 transcriptional repressor [Candidatus Ornithospirochaeta sp.]